MPLGPPGLPGKFLSQWPRLQLVIALQAAILPGNLPSQRAGPTPLLFLRAIALLHQQVPPRNLPLRLRPLGLRVLPGKHLLRKLLLKPLICLRVAALLCQYQRPLRQLTRSCPIIAMLLPWQPERRPRWQLGVRVRIMVLQIENRGRRGGPGVRDLGCAPV